MDDNGVISQAIPLEAILVCPHCHGRLARQPATLLCLTPGCGFRGTITDGIVNVLVSRAGPSFFDSRFSLMLNNLSDPNAHRAFYAEQSQALEERFGAAKLILDVGCGPRLPYERPRDSVLIGIDMSYDSLRHNKDADIRLYGSALELPFGSGSVDAIVCFYALHHFVGTSVRHNESLVSAAFQEFARVLRSGGHLFVFEVAPWRPAWMFQRLAWNRARRIIGKPLDMFFWTRQALTGMSQGHLPKGTTLEYRNFKVSPFLVLPPMFSLQRFRIPRFLYPFDICMYDWCMT